MDVQVVRVAFPTGSASYAYSYEVPPGEEPLELGDVVEVPPNWVSEDGAQAVVVAFGDGGYKGKLSWVVRKVSSTP
jgi:primosomal protein N'